MFIIHSPLMGGFLISPIGEYPLISSLTKVKLPIIEKIIPEIKTNRSICPAGAYFVFPSARRIKSPPNEASPKINISAGRV